MVERGSQPIKPNWEEMHMDYLLQISLTSTVYHGRILESQMWCLNANLRTEKKRIWKDNRWNPQKKIGILEGDK